MLVILLRIIIRILEPELGFLMCYRGTALPETMYLADLGGGVPPAFYQCDGIVDGKDLALFLLCYKGSGP
jgi:hypothetical protein